MPKNFGPTDFVPKISSAKEIMCQILKGYKTILVRNKVVSSMQLGEKYKV